jgi:predicted ATPase/DNA-binding winged helix-turn-helix (wHTH) protein
MNSILQLPPPAMVEFGPFRLFSSARRLEKDGRPVKIGSRALDILICLAEQPGQPVSNPALIKRVWRGLVVEQSSLRVNIAGLRRTLDDSSHDSQYIANIPGQGYCLVAPVICDRFSSGTVSAASEPARFAYPMPRQLRRMVGREELVPVLSNQLQCQRFVTIVGPGGIGKTTTAIAIAHTLRADFNEAICFIDLGLLTDPDLLANTILAMLGLPVAGNSQGALVDWLQDRKFLLILDNCEHLIGDVAALAEQLYLEAPQLCILATSREALRAGGEHVYRLPPLEVPPDSANLNAAQALTFSAVQLFVERATNGGAAFELSDADVPLVGRICRQLDGIALAIELNAGRVAAFGLQGTADLLSNGALLSCQGRRTALPRHQTLTAMLDSSYGLLPEFERKVLRRLSVIVGSFSLDSALRMTMDSPQGQSRMLDALDNLVAKSLIGVEMSPHGLRYHLLECTRAYCKEKLIASGEAPLIFRRNAEEMIAALESSATKDSLCPAFQPSLQRLACLGNLRACIEWCFSDAGDTLLGARLCAAGVPTLLRLSLIEECQRWSVPALARIAGRPKYQREEMVLQEARALALMFLGGDRHDMLAAIERGLELAQRLGDRCYQLRLLAALNSFRISNGNFVGALEVAVQSANSARTMNDPTALALAEWRLGVSYNLVGNHDAALRHCEAGMTLIDIAGKVSTISFGYDYKIRAMAAMTCALWHKGERTKAAEMAWQTIAEAQQLQHPISSCIALFCAASVFCWNGNWEIADNFIEQLSTHANKYMLTPYVAAAHALQGKILLLRGQSCAGISLLRACLDTLYSGQHRVLSIPFLTALAEELITQGELREARVVIEKAAAVGINSPEIVRIQGMLSPRRRLAVS